VAAFAPRSSLEDKEKRITIGQKKGDTAAFSRDQNTMHRFFIRVFIRAYETLQHAA
jgi:hypothetical protein